MRDWCGEDEALPVVVVLGRRECLTSGMGFAVEVLGLGLGLGLEVGLWDLLDWPCRSPARSARERRVRM